VKDTDLAWCAGIIDGEGTITFKANNTERNLSIIPTIMFTMTHRETVEHFKSIVRTGTVFSQGFPQSPNHKEKFVWLSANTTTAIFVIKLIEPYLITKKKQAQLVLEYAAKCLTNKGEKITLEVKALRLVLLEEMKELNRKGPKN
jgi:hypothetical protein